MAYSDPGQLSQIDDHLPQRSWFPVFLRCRELRDAARASFGELLDILSQHEPVRQYASTFRIMADRALIEGRVLLLIDGLDEISDPGDRAAFVCTIRSTLYAYPNTGIVITSREAGFRHVAAHLAPVCTHSALSPFDAADIRRLTVSWHREVVGDTQKVGTEALQLADVIIGNDRILRLANNPLLLTTLLLVKRWVGSLPTRRAVLYAKAVEVLLMTWNTEGHAPIAEEEAMPQLCYLANSMMLRGVLKISRSDLAKVLRECRDSLPTELGYVTDSVETFIERVEERSSLLMMSGFDVEDGRLMEFFEFRHLTFQEFLAARAAVEGWYPSRVESDSLSRVLEPHFEDEKWREVIPLAAVLGGKATEGLIRTLSVKVRITPPQTLRRVNSPLSLLVDCLADEASASPTTIQRALKTLAASWSVLAAMPATKLLLSSKYGRYLRDELSNLGLDVPASPSS